MIRLISLLALVCVMLPSSAQSRRYSLEGYYARHHHHQSHRHRYHTRSRSVLRRESREGTLREGQGFEGRSVAVPYQYAVGNVVNNKLTGQTPYIWSDRLSGGGRCYE